MWKTPLKFKKPHYRRPNVTLKNDSKWEIAQVPQQAMATRHSPNDHGQSARPDNRSKANSEFRALCSENKLFAKKRQLKKQETAYQCANAKVLYRSCQTEQI